MCGQLLKFVSTVLNSVQCSVVCETAVQPQPAEGQSTQGTVLQNPSSLFIIQTRSDPLRLCENSPLQGEFNALANELGRQYPDRARLWFAYNEPLSHLIYAGSDIFLVPSMFEPCGLTQLIAMR